MEALAFLKPMGEQQLQIIAQNKELSDLIKRVLARPVPAPELKIDHQQLASEIKRLMGDPAGKINQANEDLKATVNQFGYTARDVPKSVSIRGDFYGFTSWKPFIAHYLIIILAVGFGAYSWYYNSDNAVINRLHRDRTILNGEMAVFKKNNPGLTNKYFPEYMNVWDKTKLWWKEINDL